ncbi:hypothetical protein AB3Y40_01050 [Yoonia sp. R2331]|uniref:hypothetical protein n=1 Tax=Yoonia sp. R2331 TaxID=3237238 RepID=UPI0034E5188E
MKITRNTDNQIGLSRAHPYWLSGGRLKFETRAATLVKMGTTAGPIDWGDGTLGDPVAVYS